MGPEYWKPGSPTALKKCSERISNDCDPAETDSCCAVIPCTYCIEWNPETGDTVYAAADFATNGWTATIAGVAWFASWQRNYDTNECEFVVTLDDVEIYRKSCYEGQSCRDSSDSAAATIDEIAGVITWTKYEPRPLEYIQDPDTNCTTYFCDECECSCECLCVTITDYTDTVVATGEICDVAYQCDPPLWSGTVGPYDLSLALDRDEYGRCVIVPTVDGEEQDAVYVTGCKDMSATIVLYDGTTIAVACKICSCDNNGPLPCCPGFPAPNTLEMDVTLNSGDCSCFALVGGSYTVTLTLVVRQPGYYEYHGIRKRPEGCNASDAYDGFIFICREDATEGAELHLLQEVYDPLESVPTIPITVTAEHAWFEDFPPQSVSTEDCVFPLFVFEFGENQALDACDTPPTPDVTIVVHA